MGAIRFKGSKNSGRIWALSGLIKKTIICGKRQMTFNSQMMHSKHTKKKEPIHFQMIKLQVATVFTMASKSILSWLCSK